MNSSSFVRRLPAIAFLLLLFVVFGQTDAKATPIVGLTRDNELVLFDSSSPEMVFNRKSITNLTQAGEQIIGIDWRVATGQLYGVSNRSRIYVLNPVTGKATAISADPFSPALPADPFQLELGFDIDPVADQIRVIGCSVNLRISPLTGMVVGVGTSPTFAPGQTESGGVCVEGAAYTNNFKGATTTTLYAINPNADWFLRVGSTGGSPLSPDTGQVFLLGNLLGFRGFFTELAAFDIAPRQSSSGADTAYAALTGTDASATRLFSVDLGTGHATEIGFIGLATSGTSPESPGTFLRGMAILPSGANIYAVTESNKLMLLNSSVPGAPRFLKPITGLEAGDQVLGIDMRPSNNQIYGVATANPSNASHEYHLYVIDGTTAAATRVGSSFSLSGTAVGIDFEPTTGQLRVVSSTGQNVRVNPDTGATTADSPLAYATGDPGAGQAPRVVGLAYTNNTPGATSTTLYGIDSDRDTLVRQETPNSGTLTTVGSLNLLTSELVGFDIERGTGTAYATLNPLCFEGCLSFLFTIDLPSGRAQVVGEIGGDAERVRAMTVASPNTFSFTSTNYTVSETCQAYTFRVTRSGDASQRATVDYATSEGGLNPASQRSDYNAAYGTLVFNPGETMKTVTLLVNNDSYLEPPETLLITLSNPSDGHALGFSSVTTVIILDPPQESPGNIIDDSRGFVCQQYHDFLNRDPDGAGFNFWVENIEKCGTDAHCREVKRIETSAAFFLSIEFRETGFLVYRFHQAAFNTGEHLSLRTFLTDTQEIGRDVIVGVPGWEQAIEQHKQAYAERFVARPEFRALYPSTMSNAQYVDALNANTGNSLTTAERNALVAQLDAGTITRAQALRNVAENAEFGRRHLNRAFVLMQYFGYLRREPPEPPEPHLNFDGYNFWLGKLNEFNGDFRRAEMVKAFITSGEYRHRFGSQ